MNTVNFKRAYYIKLGQSNKWAKDSIANNKIRIGWPNQSIDDIKNGNWDKIRNELSMGDEGAVTRDLNSLRNIVSTDEIIFMTFYNSKLYWCKPQKNSISGDEISKYLLVDGEWLCKDINNKKEFFVNQISGKLSKYQAYRATCCRIGESYDEVGYLKRLINNEESQQYLDLLEKKNALIEMMDSQIQILHPKDFEILMDLIFRQAGWKRISVLGETMKFFDLILEETISGLRYGVQIKTKSRLDEFEKYVNEFKNLYSEEFDKFIFVAHSPDKALKNNENIQDNIEFWSTQVIAKYVVDLGLTNWLLDKVKQ